MTVNKETNKHSVIHTVGSLHPRTGGPARTVSQLTAAIAKNARFSVSLVSQKLIGDPVITQNEAGVDRRIEVTKSRILVKFALPLLKGLRTALNEQQPAILHDHGVWMPCNHHVAVMARKTGIPLVIHPRGMLEPWALQHRGWKKRVALRLYQNRNLETVELFFATSELEAENIRQLGFRQPIAVIPNGVDVLGSQSIRAFQAGAEKGQRIALFLSRIHPKKGLLNLVEAWADVRPTNWRLCLAGPDENGHLSEVMRRVQVLGLGESVEYVGEVEGDTKAALYESADLFILPSFSENFGVVVAEALAYGVPVITTRGTPWEGLTSNNCGWWVDPTVQALAITMRDAMSMDSEKLRIMGAKGRVYSGEFNWANIGQQTVDAYKWVLGQGSKPGCVFDD